MKNKLLTLCVGIGLVLGASSSVARPSHCLAEYEQCMLDRWLTNQSAGECYDFYIQCEANFPG